jgi:hypothetical protein
VQLNAGTIQRGLVTLDFLAQQQAKIIDELSEMRVDMTVLLAIY